MEEFINLRQKDMSVQQYSLKFTQFSKYASSLVPNTSDEMSLFVMGVSNYIFEEFRATMLQN